MSMTRVRKRSARAVAVVLGAVALLAAWGVPANAVTITSATPTTGLSNGSKVTVKLSFSGTEAFYALAQCNDDLADGRACNGTTAIGLKGVSSFPPGGEQLTVNNPFTNASLIPGVPAIPGTTTCKGSSGSNCAIFASTYDANGKQVDSKQVAITFK